MRRVLGAKAVDVAELFGVTPETISRWETGRVPFDRAAWITLGTIVLDRLEGSEVTIDRLRAAATPNTRRPREIHLDARQGG